MRQFASLLIAFAVGFVATPAFAGDVVDYEPFSELLAEHVDGQGRVAYETWMNDQEDAATFKKFLGKIAEADPEGYSEAEKLAFWLNAYNATAIKSVMDHWPMEGPMEVKGFFKVETHEVAGEEITLDHLEHQIIRKRFDEPRIHFVLVCAAKSCPRLRQKALTGSNVESVMEAAAREFIPRATTLEKKGGEGKDRKVVTSKLFEWFAEDFEEAEGSVRTYLKKYVTKEKEDGKEAVAEALGDEDVEITFREYDWALNKR